MHNQTDIVELSMIHYTIRIFFAEKSIAEHLESCC